MLNRILELSLQNRLVVLISLTVLTLSGLILASQMNVDVFPDLSAPTVTVITEVHGLEAEEVERLVTYQLETAINGAPDLRRIRSSSAAGVSVIWAEFEWGMDIYLARQVINERIAAIRESLPDEASAPIMAPISSIMGEVMLVGITSDSMSPLELRTIADWEITPRLKSIEGVANVVAIGGGYKQYQVQIDPEKMRFHEISLNEVVEKVQQASQNATGGYFEEHGNQYVIKGTGRAFEIREIEESLLHFHNGSPITISDVAEVKITAADKLGDGSMNANQAVIMTISKQPGVNTLVLTERLDETLDQLRNSLSGDLQIHSDIFRQADFIAASIQNLNSTLLEGAFFVVVVLFIFLMNWRTTIISLLAIPISLIVSVIVLQLLGYTINTMSLGGMAIAIGALVDDAIIDVENVYKRLRENAMLDPSERRPILQVVKDASVEIRSSIIIATLIIVVSFVPLFFLSGMEGRLLKPLGIAFITSVLTSLFVAVTLTPVMCSYMLGNEAQLIKRSKGTWIERKLAVGYERSLQWFLKHAKIVVLSVVLLFAGSMVLVSGLGRSFLPEFNEGSLVISLVGMPGMSLAESNRMGTLAEQKLLEMDEISILSRRTGRAEKDEHALGVNASEIDAPFNLNGKSRQQFYQEVREVLSVIPGVNVTLGQPISHRIDHMLSGTRANIAVKIFGPELPMLLQIGQRAEALMKSVDGLVDVSLEQQIEVPQIRIKPNRQILAAYGMTVGEFMEQVEWAFGGKKVGEVFEGQRYFDLIVRFAPEDRTKMESLKSALISLPNGRHVELHQLAEVVSASSPNSISRENVQRKTVVSTNVQGTDLRTAVEDVQTLLSTQLDLPDGYHVEYGGQFESETRASQLLAITAILAILIIFFLLYLEFRDFKLAFIVLLNLPLALIGGILIVHFTSGVVSIASTIGFISLFGIATRNGILLVSRYEDLKLEGLQGMELLIEGAKDRLNPILMTAFTTGLALVPLALKGEEAGNELQSPMAIVILGGLLSATLLNLIVIPAVYRLTGKQNRN